MPDEEAIHQAVLNAYKVIGFKKGSQPDYEAFKKYFLPDAQLINYRNDSLSIINLDQFLGGYKKLVDSGHIKSFYEEEIFGRTDQYGRVAQRISSFRTYMNNTDSVTDRGVNSFQLVKTPEGWKVTSVIWDVEKQSLPIPQHYLEALPPK